MSKFPLIQRLII